VVNERLRRAIHRAGYDLRTLAEAADVSVKSVERWLAGTSTPYPRTRYRVAALLGEDESYLWPDAVNVASLVGAEVVATYPRRNDVPRHLWTDLLRHAQRSIDVLAFAGLFLTEDHPEWTPTVVGKIQDGVRVRLLLGDPDGYHVAARDTEDRIGHGVVAGRVAAVLAHYEDHSLGRGHIRLFDAPLYNSIYRFDDDMLVNTHVYGVLAAHTPTVHLRRIDGRYFETYIESFERLWATARPAEQR
jgi:transcriptional regulator with XRE-family HTH domain